MRVPVAYCTHSGVCEQLAYTLAGESRLTSSSQASGEAGEAARTYVLDAFHLAGFVPDLELVRHGPSVWVFVVPARGLPPAASLGFFDWLLSLRDSYSVGAPPSLPSVPSVPSARDAATKGLPAASLPLAGMCFAVYSADEDTRLGRAGQRQRARRERMRRTLAQGEAGANDNGSSTGTASSSSSSSSCSSAEEEDDPVSRRRAYVRAKRAAIRGAKLARQRAADGKTRESPDAAKKTSPESCVQEDGNSAAGPSVSAAAGEQNGKPPPAAVASARKAPPPKKHGGKKGAPNTAAEKNKGLKLAVVLEQLLESLGAVAFFRNSEALSGEVRKTFAASGRPSTLVGFDAWKAAGFDSALARAVISVAARNYSVQRGVGNNCAPRALSAAPVGAPPAAVASDGGASAAIARTEMEMPDIGRSGISISVRDVDVEEVVIDVDLRGRQDDVDVSMGSFGAATPDASDAATRDASARGGSMGALADWLDCDGVQCAEVASVVSSCYVSDVDIGKPESANTKRWFRVEFASDLVAPDYSGSVIRESSSNRRSSKRRQSSRRSRAASRRTARGTADWLHHAWNLALVQVLLPSSDADVEVVLQLLGCSGEELFVPFLEQGVRPSTPGGGSYGGAADGTFRAGASATTMNATLSTTSSRVSSQELLRKRSEPNSEFRRRGPLARALASWPAEDPRFRNRDLLDAFRGLSSPRSRGVASSSSRAFVSGLETVSEADRGTVVEERCSSQLHCGTSFPTSPRYGVSPMSPRSGRSLRWVLKHVVCADLLAQRLRGLRADDATRNDATSRAPGDDWTAVLERFAVTRRPATFWLCRRHISSGSDFPKTSGSVLTPGSSRVGPVRFGFWAFGPGDHFGLGGNAPTGPCSAGDVLVVRPLCISADFGRVAPRAEIASRFPVGPVDLCDGEPPPLPVRGSARPAGSADAGGVEETPCIDPAAEQEEASDPAEALSLTLVEVLEAVEQFSAPARPARAGSPAVSDGSSEDGSPELEDRREAPKSLRNADEADGADGRGHTSTTEGPTREETAPEELFLNFADVEKALGRLKYRRVDASREMPRPLRVWAVLARHAATTAGRTWSSCVWDDFVAAQAAAKKDAAKNHEPAESASRTEACAAGSVVTADADRSQDGSRRPQEVAATASTDAAGFGSSGGQSGGDSNELSGAQSCTNAEKDDEDAPGPALVVRDSTRNAVGPAAAAAAAGKAAGKASSKAQNPSAKVRLVVIAGVESLGVWAGLLDSYRARDDDEQEENDDDRAGNGDDSSEIDCPFASVSLFLEVGTLGDLAHFPEFFRAEAVRRLGLRLFVLVREFGKNACDRESPESTSGVESRAGGASRFFSARESSIEGRESVQDEMVGEGRESVQDRGPRERAGHLVARACVDEVSTKATEAGMKTVNLSPPGASQSRVELRESGYSYGSPVSSASAFHVGSPNYSGVSFGASHCHFFLSSAAASPVDDTLRASAVHTRYRGAAVSRKAVCDLASLVAEHQGFLLALCHDEATPLKLVVPGAATSVLTKPGINKAKASDEGVLVKGVSGEAASAVDVLHALYRVLPPKFRRAAVVAPPWQLLSSAPSVEDGRAADGKCSTDWWPVAYSDAVARALRNRFDGNAHVGSGPASRPSRMAARLMLCDSGAVAGAVEGAVEGAGGRGARGLRANASVGPQPQSTEGQNAVDGDAAAPTGQLESRRSRRRRLRRERATRNGRSAGTPRGSHPNGERANSGDDAPKSRSQSSGSSSFSSGSTVSSSSDSEGPLASSAVLSTDVPPASSSHVASGAAPPGRGRGGSGRARPPSLQVLGAQEYWIRGALDRLDYEGRRRAAREWRRKSRRLLREHAAIFHPAQRVKRPGGTHAVARRHNAEGVSATDRAVQTIVARGRAERLRRERGAAGSSSAKASWTSWFPWSLLRPAQRNGARGEVGEVGEGRGAISKARIPGEAVEAGADGGADATDVTPSADGADGMAGESVDGTGKESERTLQRRRKLIAFLLACMWVLAVLAIALVVDSGS